MTVNIYQIPSEEMDSSSYLVEEDGHVLIIDGCAGEPLIHKIEAGGWTADYLLLTHEHFDHIWCLEELRERLQTPVVACEITSQRIQDVKSNLSNIADVLYYFKTGIIRESRSTSFTCGPADITYDDEWEMSWMDHTVLFQRIPGHSPGSVIITLDAEKHPDETNRTDAPSAGDAQPDCLRDVRGRIVFTGDYLIYGEEEILRLKGGSSEDYEAVARPVLEQIPDGTWICPGHGPVYRMGDQSDESGKETEDA